MRRLVHLLILSAFLLGLAGGRVGWPDISKHFRALPASFLEYSPYLSDDDGDFYTQAQAAPQALALTHCAFSLQNARRRSFLSWPEARPVSPKHYACLGLGAGGLPS